MIPDHVFLLELLLLILLVKLNEQGHHESDWKFTVLGNHLVDSSNSVSAIKCRKFGPASRPYGQ